jgi:hypothetical protein
MRRFRVTVVDLETGETQAVEVAEGDYLLIPFAPCYLHHTQKHLTGTVQITLRDHRPQDSARCVDLGTWSTGSQPSGGEA